MLDWILNLEVIDGPLPWVVWTLAAACVVALLVRKPTGRWMRRLALAVAIGALLGAGLIVVVNITDVFGVPLTLPMGVWTAAAFAAVGLAIVSLWDSARWRKVVAIVLIPLALLSATFGINAAFGIDRTLGGMLGLSGLNPIDPVGPTPGPTLTGPLYESWNPPADMPTEGRVGVLTGDSAIPSSAGFKPRDASIYLPPAAQVDDAPALPFMVFMMGMPGNPDPSFIQTALDDMAAKNKGLAPIVIIADQLGDPSVDPLCADSQKYGGVSTYFNKDIPAYAKSKLNILEDPRYWTMSGYSNGGACAFTWASQYPETWGNLVDISGDEYPGVENPTASMDDIYDGDQQKYDASKPAAYLEQNAGKFAGHVAVFTVGANDAGFEPGAQRASQLAQNAGFTMTYYVVPGADHNESAINGGLPEAFEVLYPVLGLSAP